MDSFIYEVLPSRVLFGEGKIAEVGLEVGRLGARALLLSTQNRTNLATQLSENLGDLAVGIHNQAIMHVPQKSVDKAVHKAKELNADVLVAIGGGSTIGLAKGIALETDLPILAIPTTYSGSEMTSIWGISQNGQKTTGRNPVVKPKTVIYDPELTKTLPVATSATSGMNAIAHSVEALYAENKNPIVSLMAEESIRALAASLPKINANPNNMTAHMKAQTKARSEALYGAWLAGDVLGKVGMALHHKLCHVLGGSFGLPHAETHTVVLPHALAYNASHSPEAMASIGKALNTSSANAAGALHDLETSLNTPISLRELGLNESQLDEAADLAVQKPYFNPRPITKEGIREVLQNAYEGNRPLVVI